MDSVSDCRVDIKTFDIFPCICKSSDLFWRGCKCGSFAAAKSSAEAWERVRLYAAQKAKLRERDFLIKPPTPPITFKDVCPRCFHVPHGTGQLACTVPRCDCGAIR